MDLDEWEFLSHDGYLDFNEDGEKQISPGGKVTLGSETKSVFDMDYFYTSPASPRRLSETPRVLHNHLVPLPIQLEPLIGKSPHDGSVTDITTNQQHPILIEADQDTVSQHQVFFKIKENEFVDMKIESPRMKTEKGEAMEIITSPRMKIEKDHVFEQEDSTWEEEENTGGFNIWKWSLTGFGAIFSFGVAAATICVLFSGNQQRKKLQKNQKIQFQIYADDKRIKQVVQHATKLNEAISAVRGVPISRAQITIGGYYDGL